MCPCPSWRREIAWARINPSLKGLATEPYKREDFGERGQEI